jgi:acyl carrier protein
MQTETYQTKEVIHNGNLFSFIHGVNVKLPNTFSYIDKPVNTLIEKFFELNPYLVGKVYPAYAIVISTGEKLLVMNGKFSFMDFFKHLKNAEKISFALTQSTSEVIDFEFYELLKPKNTNTMETTAPTLEKITEILIDELAETAYLNVTETITSESKMEDLALDSLDTVEVIMKVEKRLNIKVNDNELDSSIQKMTVGKFAEWINNRIQN